MGYLKSLGTVIIYIGLFLAVITFLPGLPPETEFFEYSIKVSTDPEARFDIINRLQGAEVLFSGEIKGPESFASYDGEIYTGLRGGYVVKIEENRIVPIVKFGKKCDGLWQEEKCGRPLGLKFNNKGELFVTDAYYGIFKVDINTRQYINIVNSSIPINGKIPRLVNSLDIAKNGDIYWTDSSTDFPLHDGIYSFLANPSGRLIRYDAVTKKNEVLVQNMGFGNGILLSDDESFVIVAETLHSRIIKYHLKGSKAGQQEIFAEALPGLPDNIHSDGQGGFLVSLFAYVDALHPFLPQSLMPHPYIRKMLVRLLYLIEAPFKLLEDVYPNYYAETVLYLVGSFDTLRFCVTKGTSIILRMDKAGNVLDALYSIDGKVRVTSSAYIHNKYLWLGSPWTEYIMRVPLKQAFPDLKDSIKSENVKEQIRDEPLPTVRKMPNVKIEVKPTYTKSSVRETTPKLTTITTPKPATKIPATQKPVTVSTIQKPVIDATTQKPVTDATTQKPVIVATTQKSVAGATTPKLITEKPAADVTTLKPVIVATTQKPVTDATTLKLTTEKPVADVTMLKSSTQKSTTHSHLTTITPNPPTSKTLTKETKMDNSEKDKKDNIKEIKKANLKMSTKEIKEDNLKEVKKDNMKEIKKVNSDSNINTKTSNIKTKSSEKDNKARGKTEPDESLKNNVQETQSEKSKPVEKKTDSTKK